MNFDVFTYLFRLAFIYIYSRLAIHFAPIILFYFINSNFGITGYLEKPRILFHLTGLSFMHLMFTFHQTYESSGVPIQLLVLLVFFLGVFFCLILWGEKFKSSFSEKLRIKAAKPSFNFNLSISDIQINRLYNEMIRFDLIDQEETSIADFKNVLLKDWNSHSSKIHPKMDGPSCREFYEYLIKTFPNNSITLKNLFITSGLILRPDGKKYNYNTLKNAPTRTPISKQNEVLNSIFQRLK
tara:strand:+ start:248 stop:967 length:720 start_codon:yes stop_codon:yes gene_type:complete